jgi:amidase
MRVVESARRFADGLLREHDVWLTPAAPGAAPHGLASTGDPLFNRMASVLHTPAISMPAYQDVHGMPLGLQLIGARFEDAKLLSNAGSIFNVMSGTKT